MGPGEPPVNQASACFILSVNDTMPSIQRWIASESEIFRGGSGAGVNLSRLRGDGEPLSNGGQASGPVSFMRWADSGAGSIKSGGGTRRAAKMVILDADHPDILEFVRSKAHEEQKAYALGEMGYDLGLNGDAWRSIQFQNANNSVRLTDDFFRRVEDGEAWQTRTVAGGEPADEMPAAELLREISEAAWVCGDPGVQYEDTIQRWHTSPNAGRISGSNPCSEYMHIDDSACNLASINLMEFLGDDGTFAVDDYRHAVRVMLTAQEIIVTPASYPTKRIGDNARAYRQLGLGYTNLGSLLMCQGLAYDSEAGRAWAAAITALLQGEAYAQSARVAARVGAYDGYDADREAQDRVVRMHRDAALELPVHAAGASYARGARGRGRRPRRRRRARPVRGPHRRAGLPQRPGQRDRADRDDQLHDGRPDHRHRAGDRAHQLQDAGRRRLHEARQHRRRAGADRPRLRRGAARRDHGPRGRHRRHRGRPRLRRRPPAGVRLRLRRARRAHDRARRATSA